jgi:hypothetical protein
VSTNSGEGHGVPDVFQEEKVRLWMQRDEIRLLVKQAARAAIAGRPAEKERQEATTSFVDNVGDYSWWGELVFDCAVAFLSLTIRSQMDVGQRATLDNADFNTELIRQDIAELKERTFPQSPEAVRALIEPRLQREERERLLADDQRPERLVNLAQRVVDGDLQAAETAIRIALFRSTAAALARVGRCDEAEAWIEQARLAGANDLSSDRARLALNRDDFGKVFDLIGNRNDSTSIMLIAEALKRRDGLEAGLSYIRNHLPAADMGGFALTTAAIWIAQAGDWSGAERLLAGATPEQSEENPIIPYIRMRLRLALMLPTGKRQNLLDSDGTLPDPDELRNDAEGRRLTSAAINDLAEFRLLVPNIPPDKASWFDAQQLYLRLTDRSTPDHAAAVDEIKSLATKPATAVLFGYIAHIFELDFDQQVLNQELARKKLFGSLTGLELLAAYRLTRDSGSPEDVAAFAKRHHDALLAAGIPLQGVIGPQIEIAAKIGKLDDAKQLFSEWKKTLEPDVVTRIETIIAQVSKDLSAVEAWRSAFQKTGNDAELVQLVGAMIPANDPELGKFAVELWVRRHRVDEMTRVANTLFNAGRDAELDILLDAIGDAGNHDYGIARHKAWAAFRHGRLADARAQCAVLRAERPDDEGLRQLEINIILESGKWRELGAIANEDWQRRNSRNARQLLQAAECAQVIQDPLFDELVRAAGSIRYFV